MMSERFAQYSAYMVMEKKYGKDHMHRVNSFLDRYLVGTRGAKCAANGRWRWQQRELRVV